MTITGHGLSNRRRLYILRSGMVPATPLEGAVSRHDLVALSTAMVKPAAPWRVHPHRALAFSD